MKRRIWFEAKHLSRRFYYCWLCDRHWTTTYRGRYPMRTACCSCCGTLIFDKPHEIENLDVRVSR